MPHMKGASVREGEPLLVEVIEKIEKLGAQLPFGNEGELPGRELERGETEKGDESHPDRRCRRKKEQNRRGGAELERQQEAGDRGERAERADGEDERPDAGAAGAPAVLELMAQGGVQAF